MMSLVKKKQLGMEEKCVNFDASSTKIHRKRGVCATAFRRKSRMHGLPSWQKKGVSRCKITRKTPNPCGFGAVQRRLSLLVLATARAIAARLAIAAAALSFGTAVARARALGAGGADALVLGSSEGKGGGGNGQRECDHAEYGLQFRFHFHFLKICLNGARLREPARAAVISRHNVRQECALNPEVGLLLSDRFGVTEIDSAEGNWPMRGNAGYSRCGRRQDGDELFRPGLVRGKQDRRGICIAMMPETAVHRTRVAAHCAVCLDRAAGHGVRSRGGIFGGSVRAPGSVMPAMSCWQPEEWGHRKLANAASDHTITASARMMAKRKRDVPGDFIFVVVYYLPLLDVQYVVPSAISLLVNEEHVVCDAGHVWEIHNRTSWARTRKAGPSLRSG